MKITVGSIAAGAVFGALTSLVNALSSPYGGLGAPLTGTVWADLARVLSLLLDAGWSWAALAVAVGWAAGTLVRGAVAGVVALSAATVSYYVTDALVWGAGSDTVLWLVVGVPFGLVLGAVGALIRRPGIVGLLAALVVPLGAAVQMVVLPPQPLVTSNLDVVVAEAMVWTLAVLGAGWGLYRFRAGRRSASPLTDGSSVS